MKHLYVLTTLLFFLCSPAHLFAAGGDIVTEGTIEFIDSASVTVNGTTYLLNFDTEYEDSAGNEVGLSFFSAGDYVEVKGPEINGLLVAREVELENESSDDDSGDGDGDGDGDDDGDDDDDDDDSDDDDDDGDLDDDDDDDDRSFGNSDTQGNDLKRERRRLRGRLFPVPGVNTSAVGKARFRSRSRRDRSRARFVVKVKAPISDGIPELTSLAAAGDVELETVILRDGQEIAICALQFNRIADGSNGLFAEYKIDLRIRTRAGRSDRFRTKKGVCDTSVGLSGTQSGVPDVKRGDTVEIHEVTLEALSAFLMGQL